MGGMKFSFMSGMTVSLYVWNYNLFHEWNDNLFYGWNYNLFHELINYLLT
jgi:hypothetical protein